MQLKLSALKELKLGDIPNLKNIWGNIDQPQILVSFQKLHKLHVEQCHSLVKLLSEGEENIIEMIELPSLQYLDLFDLPNLRGFYNRRGTLFDGKVCVMCMKLLTN